MLTTTDTICLLDDEPSVLKALGRLLASAGLPVEKFGDPVQFLDRAKHQPMRLAVIDIRMPGMTGLEVLSELRTVAPDARVIILTGENDSAHRDAAMEGGACAFFLKPFEAESFLQAVREAMASAA